MTDERLNEIEYVLSRERFGSITESNTFHAVARFIVAELVDEVRRLRDALSESEAALDSCRDALSG